MKLHIFDDKEIMSEKLAEWICDLVSDTLKHQQFFTHGAFRRQNSENIV